MEFTHAQISVIIIDIPMPETACIHPCQNREKKYKNN